jgi:tetratricopeptide (TPR) repeat protein
MKKITALGLFAAVLTVSACASDGPETAPPPHEAEPYTRVGPASSPLGAYLAARLALENNDTQAAADYLDTTQITNSDNTELLQDTLLVLLTEGRMTEAKAVANRVLVFDQDQAWALILLGVDAAAHSEYSEARKRFAAIPKRTVNGLLGPLLLAWSLAGNGLVDGALEALSPLAQYEGFKAAQALHAGLILDQAGRVEAALDQYRIALAGPLNIRTIEAVGSAYQRLGRQEEARQLYARYMAEHPDTMLFNGATLLAKGKDIDRPVPDAKAGMAAVFFDVSQLLRQTESQQMSMIFNRLALSLQPDFPLAQMTAADQLQAKGRVAEANDMLRSISMASPVHAFAHLKLAANLDEMGDEQQALTELKTLQIELPNTIEIPITLGDIERRHKKFNEAAAAYTQALALFKGTVEDSWSLYFSRAICYERAHDWPKAEADFRHALTLKPEQPDVLNYLGYTWIDHGINLQEAKGMVERAVRLRPGDGAFIDSLGWVLYRLGDFYQAVGFLEKAVELKPVDSTINEHLGDVYFKVGRIEEAKMQWRRALALDPEPEQLDALKEKDRTGRLPEAIQVSK